MVPPPASASPSVRRLRWDGEGVLAVTIDVEEWFHVCGDESGVPAGDWDRLPSDVDRGLDRLLGILDRRGVRATVFVLGWLARRRPDLVRRLADAGHEVASHADGHVRFDDLDPEARRREAAGSRRRLQDLSGQEVLGFRAPEWSIRSTGDPSLRLLAEEGYGWDASVTPVPGLGRRDNPVGPVECCWADGRALRLFPPLTGSFLGWVRLPAGGAWTGRLLPFPWVAGAVEGAWRAEQPAVLTAHPWEFDEAHPPDPFPLSHRLMHHAGLARAEVRLETLLALAGGRTALLSELARTGERVE